MGLKEREEKRRTSVVGSMISGSSASEGSGAKQKDKKQLIQRGYYLEPVTAQAVKEKAVKEGMKDYEIVEAALQEYLKSEIEAVKERNR